MTDIKNCTCGAPNCWGSNDSSWLASNSGWRGDRHGTIADIFFIHGRRIREQRHLQGREYPLDLTPFAEGLPNARLVVNYDDDGASIWIEGERDPEPADLERLAESRQRQLARARQDLAWNQRTIAAIVAAIEEDA